MAHLEAILTLLEQMKKSAAMYLQEVCTKQGCTYRTSETDLRRTPSDEPNFEVTLSVNNFDGKDYEGIGRARSKKDAKQKAALELLAKIMTSRDLMDNVVSSASSSAETPIPMDTTGSATIPSGPCLPTGQEISSTACQDLIELCEKKGLPNADYKELADDGPPHLRVFTWECRVKFPDGSREDLVVVDKAGQKTKAKRLVASKMIEKIRAEVSIVAASPTSVDGLALVGSDSLTLGGENVSICDNRAKCNELFAHDHHRFHSFQGNSIRSIHENLTKFEEGENYIAMLNQIADEENFVVEYDELPGLNNRGNVQCACQMTYKFKGYSPSPSVIFGCGLASETAQNHAAYESLQFLKGVTNSSAPVG